MKRIQLEMNNTRGPYVKRQNVNKLLELRTSFCLPKRFCLQHAPRPFLHKTCFLTLESTFLSDIRLFKINFIVKQ